MITLVNCECQWQVENFTTHQITKFKQLSEVKNEADAGSFRANPG